jgi:hypothetical protein
MAVIIPITNDANQELKATLDDSEYFIRLRYNVRGEYWTLDMLTAGKTPIVTGVAIRVSYSLLSRYVDTRLPDGKLYAIDTSGEGLDPALDDMGERVLLAYDSEVI